MPDPLSNLFGTPKPVIAMAHLGPLPGTPLHDTVDGGVEALLDALRRDVDALLAGGVDALLFCNEADRPYALKADLAAVATMTRIVTELRPRDRPFGVDFLWDPEAALCMAAATGASFMREVVTGVYESDMGLWRPDAAALYRLRRAIGADGVKVFANVTPEFASPLGSRTAAQRARSAVVSTMVDAILVAGPRAGAAPELSDLKAVKDEVGDEVPVLLNTGARAETIGEFLGVADGVIVGSSLKVEGYTWNPVDPPRVTGFMDAVRTARRG
jgi:hypothetical protein